MKCVKAIWMARSPLPLVAALALVQALPRPLPAQEPERALRPQQADTSPAVQEARIALVIGNGAYKDAPLKNPPNDARAVGEALKRCGFAVTELENAGRNQMREAIRAFGSRIAEGGVGLFYFAGHGMQVKGRNFLIPVGADIASEDEVASEALEVDAILAKMETARNRLNILILDACRNNPFGRSFRSSQQGLAQLDAPTGTFVAFATAPGRTAADGSGANGLYTQHLLANLRAPGMKLEEVFKRTRAEVLQASSRQQTPWENSSIVGDFYFVPGAASVPVAALPIVPQDKGAANYERGMDFYMGRGLPRSDAKALAHFTQAANEGSIPAMGRLGYLYEKGLGAAPDPLRAADYYRLAAEGGDALGQCGMGEACLGKLHGSGVKFDKDKALAWFQKAAAQGSPFAMVHVAECMEYGYGHPRDGALAETWFRKAVPLLRQQAQAGDLDAMIRLAFQTEFGLGTERDGAQAAHWYRKAAEKGHPKAQCELATLVGGGYTSVDGKDSVPPDLEQEALWFRKAAEQGYAFAQFGIGYMYQVGKGVAKDAAQAATWYGKAAEQGDSRAQLFLAKMCLGGEGVGRDLLQAFSWCRKAAEGGHSDAMFMLGQMYLHGIGVAKDAAQAAMWFRKVGDPSGFAYAEAQYLLGTLYEAGEGVPKDENQASEWYRRAAKRGDEDAKKALTRLGR